MSMVRSSRIASFSLLAFFAFASPGTPAFAQELTMGNVNPAKHGTTLAANAFNEKLAARLRDAGLDPNEDRLKQELAVFATKTDVAEELARLTAHVAEVRRVLRAGGSAGKRLDFLAQELHREANTLGSKSVAVETSRVSLELKVLIEQMREQVQNIE